MDSREFPGKQLSSLTFPLVIHPNSAARLYMRAEFCCRNGRYPMSVESLQDFRSHGSRDQAQGPSTGTRAHPTAGIGPLLPERG